MSQNFPDQQVKPRARDLGVPFPGDTGPFNAITDVAGVEVGHSTIISSNGALEVGVGPVRTGVTVVMPRGKDSLAPVFAGWFALNGNGEMTGTTWIDESGFMDGPVLITNTHSVGVVRDALISWQIRTNHRPQLNSFGDSFWSLPVVAETWDGFLNDINGLHVKEEHVFAALDGAAGGPVAEGNVGGGTGMIGYQFKGGIGTASRKIDEKYGGYTVGVLVQLNCGLRRDLTVVGVPVGLEIAEDLPGPVQVTPVGDTGSIIIVVATDAPLLPHQLKRVARRAAMGLARTGSFAGSGSGDIFVAFSTANGDALQSPVAEVAMLSNYRIDHIFNATVQATEEAIINAMVAAETMVGVDNHRAIALPHDRLQEAMRKYNRTDQR